MKSFHWIALGVLMGFGVSTGVGGLTTARADMQGPGMAEAKASLAKEDAVLNQIAAQWETNNTKMQATMQTQLTPGEEAMMKEAMAMHAEIKMLVQTDQVIEQQIHTILFRNQ
jgi:hypothetical protein